MNTDDRLGQRRAFVREQCHADPDALQPASEDAGMRSYWRLADRGGVLMDAPPADNDLGSWLLMHALFDAGNVRVPAILAQDLGHGFLLMEDLGQNTLLQCVNSENAECWFDAAITQLLHIQALSPRDGLPHYDASLLSRELDFFPDWFIGQELGTKFSDKAQQVWRTACEFLIEQALKQPQVLVHRDFMPRNLMPIASELAVIDFQDAVVGPIAYDPICLFKDAFVSWPEQRVDSWLQDYHERASKAGLPVSEQALFRRDCDLIGVHRHLKVLGIFARLKHRDGKPRYLADTPRFIAYLDTVLPRYRELVPLHELLQAQVWQLWRDRAVS